ncbi:MAG: YbjQ family protein [Syntrophobacterales bacterium]|nr:MAG: YbjQ family protein [Syntrophobacterales bacterium]
MEWMVQCKFCHNSFTIEGGEAMPDSCPSCTKRDNPDVLQFFEDKKKRREFVAVSTPEVGGRTVVKSLGVVTTEQVVGFKISGELDLSKFNGGMALSLVDKLMNGRGWAIRILTDEALAMGANGLVGIDIRYESLGVKEDVLMVLVYAKGTAVIVE